MADANGEDRSNYRYWYKRTGLIHCPGLPPAPGTCADSLAPPVPYRAQGGTARRAEEVAAWQHRACRPGAGQYWPWDGDLLTLQQGGRVGWHAHGGAHGPATHQSCAG